ncbi:VCBS domain-containing protein [Williamsia sp. MIQD14]|uniref:VCBS domain-containing protein n=1 Tax=Williamsia sp. MIQD14 TaxID=3425703 RepID=UPI003DA0B96F
MSAHRVKNRAKAKARAAKAAGRGRASSQRHEVPTWVKTSAMTVGLGAALIAGSGVAGADTTVGDGGSAPAPRTSDATGSSTSTATAEPNATQTAADSSTPPSSSDTSQPGVPPSGVPQSGGTDAPTGSATPPAVADPVPTTDGTGGSSTPPAAAAPSVPSAADTPSTSSTGTRSQGGSGTGSTVNGGAEPSTSLPVPAVAPLVVSTPSGSAAITPTLSLNAVAPTVSVAPVSQQAVTPLTALAAVVLSIFGLHTSTSTTPGGPVVPAANPIGDLVVAVFRRIEDILSPYPTAQGGQTVDPTTGVVTGSAQFTSPFWLPQWYTVTAPANGSVTVDRNGRYTYTPSATAPITVTADSFTVSANNWFTRSSVVVNVPVASTAPPTTIAIVVGTPAPSTGAIDGRVSAKSSNGTPVTYSAGSSMSTQGGVVTVTTGGAFSYTPTADARHQAAATGAPDARKQDTFTVNATDGRGATTPIVVTVPLAPLNAVPVAPANQPVGRTDPATGAVTGTVTVTDGDKDPVTYTGPTSSTGGTGSVVVDTNGAYTYTPTVAARHAAAKPGGVTSDSFTVTASDGFGGSTQVVVTVPITAVNADPVAGEQVPGTVGAGGVVTGTVTTSDADGDTATYSGPTTTAGGTGSVVVNANGTYTYTPTAAAQHDAASATGAKTDTFTVTASDGFGGSTQVVVTVPITAVNADPAAGEQIPGTVGAGGVVTGTVTATDGDDDTVTFIPATTTSTSGTFTVNANGSYTYTPTAAAQHDAASATGAKSDTFSVVADDGFGGRVDIQVTVPITAVNADPVAGEQIPGTVGAGGVVTGTVTATDGDDDTVTFIPATTTSTSGTFTVNANGSYTYTPTAAAQHDAASATGAKSDTFSVVADDGFGGRVDIQVTVPITAVNADPVAGEQTPGTVGAGGVVTGTVTTTDADGDTATYSGPTGTVGGSGSVVVNANGTYTYSPTAAAQHAAASANGAKTDTFTVTASDGFGGSTQVEVTVPITAVNADPVAGEQTPGTVDTSSGQVTGTVTTTDADGDMVTFTPATSTSASGTFTVKVDGSYTYTPTAAARHDAASPTGAKTDTFTVTATDGFGGITPITVSIMINPLNAPPVVTTTPTASTIGVGYFPSGVAVGPDGRIYVVNLSSNSVSVIKNGVVVQTIDVGNGPLSAAVGSDGRVYVTNQGDNSVSVINDGAVETTIDLGARPVGVAAGADGRVYVATGSGVSVINNGAVESTIAVGAGPDGIAVGPDGRVYVTQIDGGSVAVIRDGVVESTIRVGAGPDGVGVAPDGTVYVSNSRSNSVSVIKNGVVVSTIAVGAAPNRVAVGPDGTVYVTNSSSNTVSVIRNGVVTSTIDGFTFPFGVAVGSDRVVYVTNLFGNTTTVIAPPGVTVGAPNTVTGAVSGTVRSSDADGDTLIFGGSGATTSGSVEIAPATGAFVYTPTDAARHAAASATGAQTDTFAVTVTDGHGGSISVPVTVTISPVNAAPTGGTVPKVVASVGVGSGPNYIAVGPDGRVYVTSYDESKVSVIDPITRTVTGTIALTSNPTGVGVGPDGLVYVVTNRNNRVTVIDPTSKAVLTTYSVGSTPFGIALGSGGVVYVTNQGAGTVSVIDTSTGLVRSVAVGQHPTGVAVAPSGRVYVSNYHGGTVSVIDPADDYSVTTIDTGYGAAGVAVGRDGSVYVVSQVDGTVSVIDPVTNTVTSVVTVGSDPFGVAVGADGRVYVGNQADNSLSIIDPVTNTVIRTVAAVGRGPFAVATGSNGDVYVMNFYSGTVSIVPTADFTTGPAQPGTGAVAGTVSVVDADGDTLTYGGSGVTGMGTIEVDSATGAFTFTPTAAARHDAAAVGAAKTVTFTITADDAHGGSISVPVTVTISPVNATPTAGTQVAGTANGATGVVTGVVSVTDGDSDVLTYSAPTTSVGGGAVSVDARGNYTFAPTDAARAAASAANAPDSAKTDSFVVTVSDGHGGKVPITVTVAVVPNAASGATGTTGPVGSSSGATGVTGSAGSDFGTIGLAGGPTNSVTGAVSGFLLPSNTGAGPYTFAAPTVSPPTGTVTVTSGGVWTFTPTAAARTAAASGGTTTDSFVITVSNAQGASMPVTITVAITPVTVVSVTNGSGRTLYCGGTSGTNTTPTTLPPSPVGGGVILVPQTPTVLGYQPPVTTSPHTSGPSIDCEVR